MRRPTAALGAAGVALLWLVLGPGPAAASATTLCPDVPATLPGSGAPALRAAHGSLLTRANVSDLEFRPGTTHLHAIPPTPTVLGAAVRLPDLGDVAAALQNPTVVHVRYSGFSEEARAAFEFAVDVWKSHISSPVPITIDASFEPLGPGVLGGASPAMFVRQPSPGAAWYPIALANAVHGATLLPGTADVIAYFTDDPSVWHFGPDAPPPGRFDFTTAVLHELGHGFGMTGDFAVDGSGVGSWGTGAGKGLPTVFDTFVANTAGRVLVRDLPNNSVDVGNQLTGGGLVFRGPAARQAAGGSPPALFAPPAWLDGSSVYHVDPATYPLGTPASVMGPALPPGVVIRDPGPVIEGIFRDLGWPPAPRPVVPPPVDTVAAQPVPTTTTSTVTLAPPTSAVTQGDNTTTTTTATITTADVAPPTTTAPQPASSTTTVPCTRVSTGLAAPPSGGNRRVAAAPHRAGSLPRGVLASTGEGLPLGSLLTGLGLLAAGETTRRTAIRRARNGQCRATSGNASTDRRPA